MDLISIIVPVYNVEKYIDKCVESVLAQAYKNIELILVDDGSTDLSGKKCDDWAAKDSRVVVIHKENSGSADSRNMGLDIAKGDYIGFVDSDDWVTPQMYSMLYDSLIQNNSDMSVCMFEMVNNEDELIENNEYPLKLYSGREFANIIISEKKPRISYAIWKCLFKKAIIRDLRFFSGVHYNEDAIFLIDSLWRAEKVSFIDAPLYYYRVHESSISNVNMSEKHIDDILFKCDWLIKYYKSHGNKKEFKVVRRAVINELIPYLRLCKKNPELIQSVDKISKFIQLNGLNIYDVGLDAKLLAKYIWVINS